MGMEKTATLARLEEILADARTKKRPVHFLPPYRAENMLKLMNWLGMAPGKAAAEASVELIRSVVEMRAVKGPEEIVELERAVDVSADMHLTAMRMVRPGITEAEVAAAVHRVALAAEEISRSRSSPRSMARPCIITFTETV